MNQRFLFNSQCSKARFPHTPSTSTLGRFTVQQWNTPAKSAAAFCMRWGYEPSKVLAFPDLPQGPVTQHASASNPHVEWDRPAEKPYPPRTPASTAFFGSSGDDGSDDSSDDDGYAGWAAERHVRQNLRRWLRRQQVRRASSRSASACPVGYRSPVKKNPVSAAGSAKTADTTDLLAATESSASAFRRIPRKPSRFD